MKNKILEILNQSKRRVSFVRIPLEITDKFLSAFMKNQDKNVLDFLPRKYIIVIEFEGKYYKLDAFNLVEISKNLFEFQKNILEYYPDENTYRFLYDKNGFYLDVDTLDGFNKYKNDSRKNLKDELCGVEEDE